MKLPYPFNRPRRESIDHDKQPIHLTVPLTASREKRKHVEDTTRFIALPPDPIFASTSNPYTSPAPSRPISYAFGNFDPQRSQTLNVLIVGTGFAGLATALACAHKGFSVQVLERSNGQSPHGDSVTIGSNATRLLYRWGVEELWERASRGRWMIFKDQAGCDLYREDLEALPSNYGAPLLQGKRSQFLGSMGVAARLAGVQIEYNAEVVGYLDSERPAVSLANGERRSADVIVVCDGINSSARCLLNENQPRKPSGFSIHRAIMESEPIAWDPDCSYLLDGNMRTWLGRDEWVSIYPMDNSRQIAFTYTHRDSDSSSSLNWRSSVGISSILHDLSGWDPTLQKAISKFPRALHWTIVEGEVAEHWTSKGGNITFAGDAVHPLIPASMQGATMAIEDAESLAQSLGIAGGKPENVKVALQVYEKLRKPRVEHAARLGRKQAMIYQTFTSRNTNTASRSSSITTNGSLSDDQPVPCSKFSADPKILKPLAFASYDFDAEEYTKQHFDTVVRQLGSNSGSNHRDQRIDPLDSGSHDDQGAHHGKWMSRASGEGKHHGRNLAFTTESFATLD